MDDFKKLLSKFHIKTSNPELFELALTHPSYNSENNTKHHDYERIEFIGDSVIGFVSADLIFKNHPEMDQGDMSKLRSSLVKSKPLANYARKIELYKYIRTGHSISEEQLCNSNKILEDVFEAFFGAMYLTCGITFTYKVLKDFLLDDIIHANTDNLTDPKTRLQEEMQSEYRESVKYIVVNEEGHAHDKTFFVEVLFNGIVLGKGKGKSKKEAEESAASDALRKRA